MEGRHDPQHDPQHEPHHEPQHDPQHEAGAPNLHAVGDWAPLGRCISAGFPFNS